MRLPYRRPARIARAMRWPVFLLVVVLLALPAAGAPKKEGPPSRFFSHVSQSVAVSYWIAHPGSAPSHLRERFARLSEGVARAKTARGGAELAGGIFNNDEVGFPQNEESISACRKDTNIVLGGTNDYRGLLDPEGSLTGWHFSNDGGASLTNEGLLPPVDVLGDPRPSGGDPVDVVGPNCDLYAASLAYDLDAPFENSNGVAVYKSDAETLASCPGGTTDPSCWPERRAVAEASPPHFLDKEWMDVGISGDAGEVVWVAYADFTTDADAPLGFTGASIYAVRCDADLVDCTEPILISGSDLDVQFADVTIGPDGRTYITWSEIQGELEGTPQTFIHKLRVAPAGSTEFGPTQVVAVEDRAIPFGGFLHANDFRVATYPKNAVQMVGKTPRIFLIWDACAFRLLDNICEESEIKLTYSDDGATWSRVRVISAGGDNYFPTINADPDGRDLAAAWFTNRYDPDFHNRQDVELVRIGARSGRAGRPFRVTPLSNETEADPLLGGFFIGDYIEVFVHDRAVWLHYNANYRQTRVLGEGFPIPQQDNFLFTRGG
jgi:hypothetical protein